MKTRTFGSSWEATCTVDPTGDSLRRQNTFATVWKAVGLMQREGARVEQRAGCYVTEPGKMKRVVIEKSDRCHFSVRLAATTGSSHLTTH